MYKLKAKKNTNPTELDMKHVDHIIQYLAKLQRTNDISLILGGDQGVQMIGAVDTSFAPDNENYRSITGTTSTWLLILVVCKQYVPGVPYLLIHPGVMTVSNVIC